MFTKDPSYLETIAKKNDISLAIQCNEMERQMIS